MQEGRGIIQRLRTMHGRTIAVAFAALLATKIPETLGAVTREDPRELSLDTENLKSITGEGERRQEERLEKLREERRHFDQMDAHFGRYMAFAKFLLSVPEKDKKELVLKPLTPKENPLHDELRHLAREILSLERGFTPVDLENRLVHDVEMAYRRSRYALIHSFFAASDRYKLSKKVADRLRSRALYEALKELSVDEPPEKE